MSRKILYITGSRADYGLMKNVLKKIRDDPALELDIVVTGMHLMDEFGMTVHNVERDGFRLHKIYTTFVGDDKRSMSGFVGELTSKLTEAVETIRPDIILLLGDRGEMLAGAITGAYMGILVAHIHGGELSSTIDDSVRHAITKLAHIHLPATQSSANRIIRMGEEPWRVYPVGAPGLDQIVNETPSNAVELSSRYGFDAGKPLLLVVQHPVSIEEGQSADQMRETLEAVRDIGHQAIVIYPNADAGGRRMITVIEDYSKLPSIKTFKDIPHKDYLGLMKIASVLIGNSSSGIIEAASFGLPVVNIGTRQSGRERGINVLDTGYLKAEILSGIKKSLYDERFIAECHRAVNPYGDGKTANRILDILKKINVDDRLIQKKNAY